MLFCPEYTSSALVARIFDVPLHFNSEYRVTHQVVPKLSIQSLSNSHTSPESRVWEQPDVSPSTVFLAQSPFSCRNLLSLSISSSRPPSTLWMFSAEGFLPTKMAGNASSFVTPLFNLFISGGTGIATRLLGRGSIESAVDLVARLPDSKI